MIDGLHGNRGPGAADRLYGSGAPAAASGGAALLDAIVAERGFVVPADLASPPGAGTTTLWTVNAAQTIVVAQVTRGATVDDAHDCGRIAATAALTAVHARAAAPLFARLVVGRPAATDAVATRAMVDGVAVALAEAGGFLADVDVVDAPVVRFDVLVTAVVRPDRVRGVGGAQPGDALIVGGPLGAGIYAAARERQRLSDDDRRLLAAESGRGNAAGIALGTIRNVHAVTEVGLDGLVAAALALAEAAALPLAIDAAKTPALPRALAFAKSGSVAAGSSRNWNRDGARVALGDTVMPEMRSLLTDPVPGGTLLIACRPESVERVLKLLDPDRTGRAAAIGAFAGAAADPAAGRRLLSVT